MRRIPRVLFIFATASGLLWHRLQAADPDPNAPATAENIQSNPLAQDPTSEDQARTILINFNNVNVVELIRFLSRISNKNFIFDENDLQFTVTIVSEEPATIESMTTALLQVIRIHGLTFIEEGNTIVIHKTQGVNAISRVVSDNLSPEETKGDTEMITRLFRLNSADADKIAALVRPLVSSTGLVEVFKDTNHLIVTDLISNIDRVFSLVKSLDAPNNGLVIGQYVVRTGFIDSLVQLAQQVMQPIAQGQILIFVPHRAAESIFIVSTPFLTERTMALLQYLDQNQGLTRIFDLNQLRFNMNELPSATQKPQVPMDQWQLDNQGNWVFRAAQQPGVEASSTPPEGYWALDEQGNWRFQTGRRPPGTRSPPGIGDAPNGSWKLDPQGFWIFQLAQGQSIAPQRFTRRQQGTADLPLGHIERTKFFIYKLNYRNGDMLTRALGRVGFSLRQGGTSNFDLAETIDSVQWLESSNSLLFTGTTEALEKVEELVQALDTPLRQVFMEVLILETTLRDSLNFGTQWGTRFGGGNTAGSQAFLEATSPLPLTLDTTGVGLTPNPNGLARTAGFSQGIVGQRLTHGGLAFQSIGALVTALHEDERTRIVMNPKLLTEDNYPAEIFVGINTAYPTQSVVNNLGVILTQNFEYRDVGTRIRITPQIGADNVITMLIEEDQSTLIPPDTFLGETGPTTRKNYTRTKVHIPDEYFLVISGMLEDQDDLFRGQIPCLGGIPILGGAFSVRRDRDDRHCLMMFLRPKIVQSEEDIDRLTKHQQDVYEYKKRTKPLWEYEVDGAMDFFNLPGCCEPCDPCEYRGECGSCY